jgi:hypothetical protein
MLKLTILVFLFSSLATAQDIERNSTGKLLLNSERLFMVTHASQVFDENEVAGKGINSMLGQSRDEDSVVFVMNDDEAGDQRWYTDSRDPDYAVESSDGSHQVSFTGSEVFIGGGYFTLCFDRSVQGIVNNRPAGLRNHLLTLNLLLDGIYEDKYFLLEDKENPCFGYDRWATMPITRDLWTFITEFSEDYTLNVIVESLKRSFEQNPTQVYFKNKKLRAWRGSSRQQKLRINLIHSNQL